jgi:ketosteroid isomerase-like protein
VVSDALTESIGHKLAEAIARKDVAALTALLAPDVDFKGLTPRRFWEAGTVDEVINVLFGNWFEEQDHIDGVEITEGDPVADTRHVGYRLALGTPDGPHVAEQQAYYRVDGNRISFMRVLCSGFRPVSTPVYDEGE